MSQEVEVRPVINVVLKCYFCGEEVDCDVEFDKHENELVINSTFNHNCG